MKPTIPFEQFVKEGIVKRQISNKSRARFLIIESEQDYSFLLEMLKKFNINDKNANTVVKSCYDILMELIRAKMFLDGYNATGQGAHEAEVSYLRILGFNEKDVIFANQLRFFRNGMLYYGTILDKEYANKAVEFMNRIYPKLREVLKNKI